MARRVKGGPVENEQRVAVAALRLVNLAAKSAHGRDPRFWAGDILEQLEWTEPGLSINASTVNRALNHMVLIAWMWAAWETADPADRSSSKPRLYYRFTPEGLESTRQIVRERRRSVPIWALYPEEVLAQDIEATPWVGDLELPAAGRSWAAQVQRTPG
ncbi:MAG TPA: hypothetical protein VFN61_00435 [Acidimicrobiales bacterium]|nr:hypothetical protein [Acidimicrobiales bacterium]